MGYVSFREGNSLFVVGIQQCWILRLDNPAQTLVPTKFGIEFTMNFPRDWLPPQEKTDSPNDPAAPIKHKSMLRELCFFV